MGNYIEQYLKKYIEKLNNFLKYNKEIFSNYKAIYSLQDKNVDVIIKVIILFEIQNYNTGVEEEYLERSIITFNNKNNTYFERLHKKFILTEPKLILYTIKEIIVNSEKANKLVKQKLYSDFLDLFFSGKYDLKKILMSKNFIPYFSKKNEEEIKIYDKKLNEYLPSLKGIKDEFLIYKLILKYSPSTGSKFIFENVIIKLKLLMKSYLNKLVFEWKKDLGFSELSYLIEKNILLFCKLFLNIKDHLDDRKNSFLMNLFIY